MSWRNLAVVALFGAVVILSLLVAPARARAACEMTPVDPYNPTGWEGCEAYGAGLASHWDGPGVAVNACVWPWRNCTPIRITVRATGASVVVTPTMFCDCWHGTADQRLVDLPPAVVRALGLNWADGLYPVTVEPAISATVTEELLMLPDTAAEER